MAWVLAACGGGSSATTRDLETGPLKVVGGGSRPYRIPGHHASVTEWGKEAGTAEIKAAAVVEHDYLIAVLEKDWAKACSYASEILVQGLAAHPKAAGMSCPALLAAYAKPRPGGSDYESSEVEAQSLRSDGTWAFLLFRAGARRYYMPMVKGQGGWKVNHTAPVAFED
jgi:hypothetical protein